MGCTARAPLVAVSVLVWLAGCAVIRPMRPTLRTEHLSGEPGAASSRCLLVMLPGIGDGARSFERRGFVEDAREAGLACDVTLVDAHFTYYLTQDIAVRVEEDILRDARRRGYRSIWLVGVSLGGYGAMLTARAHPGMVDGVVLVAPLLGVPPREAAVADEIRAAGGLHAWTGARDLSPPLHHFREPRVIWDWLRAETLDPARRGRVILAYGADDPRADRYALLARALPDDAVVRVRGRHDWPTWRSLWRRVLATPPWAPT